MRRVFHFESFRNAISKLHRASSSVVLYLCFSSITSAWAHDPGLSVATARVAGTDLSVHLAMARCDVERLVTLDANRNGQLTDIELKAVLPRLKELARQAFVVSCAGRPATLAKATVQRDNQDGVHFQLSFSDIRQGQLAIHSALLARLPRGHRQFLSVRDEKGNLLSEQMLEATHNTLTLERAADPQTPVVQHPVREFLALGIMHIATGYDHLLFLLGLLLVGGTLRSALQIITSFTCAHSITLALATLHVIHLSPRIIEPLIAASIIYVGLENLLRPAVKGRWRLTFAFGLIHGCGFASALQDLGVGANGSGIVTPLVSFNLGVELGQMTIAALVLPIIWKFRSSPVLVQRLAPIGSALIVVAGSFWLLQRTLF